MTATQENSTAPERTIGNIIDTMLELRDKRSVLDKESKALKAEYEELEGELLHQLNNQGTKKSSTPNATAWISETIVPNIKDWTAFEGYIRDNDAFYMLEKRPSSTAFRELIQQGESVPGLEPFTKISISLRRL